MNFVCLDSTAVVEKGPGSPAYFSRFLVEYLKAEGHTVTITNGFYPDLCAHADAVWTEWGNDDAFEAAASGLCKRLIVRLRGVDAFAPLDRLEWSHVDALVYESPFLKQLVEERFPGLRGFRSHVIPSGIDVASIPFKERKPGPVVALVARGVADKGYQLTFEWARQRPDIQLYVALALPEPRLLRYLQHTKPPTVTICGQVDTVRWLDEINANYLLSASNWESLGYTIAEAMAMGIKPLIHDTPGAELNWPGLPLVKPWRALVDLVGEMQSFGYDSRAYRAFVEEHLDTAKQSAKFAELLTAPATRRLKPPEGPGRLIAQTKFLLDNGQHEMAERTLQEFRDRAPRLKGLDDARSGLALQLAMVYYANDDLDRARVWALRSLDTIVRPDTLCLLGEIAMAENDVENAERWYCAAMDIGEVPTRYPSSGLLEKIRERWVGLDQKVRQEPPREFHPVRRFLIVVAVRNAEKYIGTCLESIKQQHGFHCVVIDDASTDGTLGQTFGDMATLKHELGDRFTLVRNPTRKHSLRNIVETIQRDGQPNDVVVIVDGDDQLTPLALHAIQGEYMKGAWMTYGNFITTSGGKSWMPPYPKRVIEANSFREWPWSVSHPKTFRKELFDHINPEDFKHEGQWFHTAGDVALMMPMLEMAAERAVYVPSTLYIWNDQNGESDHNVDPDGQVRVRNLILAKPKYKRLEKL